MQFDRNMDARGIWDRFERKTVLCCTKYLSRYRSIIPELERVGLTDCAIQWDVADSPIKHILHKSITTGRHLSKMGHFSCCLSHYNAIKTSFELGCQSVLIIEDDVRFRRNIDEIRQTVAMLPDDYDYAQFEFRKPASMEEEYFISLHKRDAVNQRWCRFSDLRGGGCYALSRKAMGKMIAAIEDRITDDAKILRINDFYVSMLTGINKYFCFPPVAVQVVIQEHNSPMSNYWHQLNKMGVSINDYGELPRTV